jgi:CheY-like chemotaxis protein
MSTLPLNVVAVSNDALRPELLDRLLVDDNNINVIVVESIERAHSRITQLQPDVVVVFMNIDDVDACRLLSMLHMDHGLRGVSVVICTTGPGGDATHRSHVFEERCDTRVTVAS